MSLSCDTVDEPMSTSRSRISEEASLITEIKTPEEAPEATDSSSSSYKDLSNAKSTNKETVFSTASAGTPLSDSL